MTTLTLPVPFNAALARPAAPVMTLTPTPVAERVSFRNLLRAETRKAVDTRATQIFLSVITLLALAATVATPLILRDEIIADTPWSFFLTAPQMVVVIFLPIIAVMLFANEWSQNSVLSTFVTEPRRSRVLLAKTTATAALSVVSYLLVLALGAAAAGGFSMATGVDVAWDFEWRSMLGLCLVILYVSLQGAALGLLFMNTPLAIIIYVTAPMVLGLLPNFGEKAQEVFTGILPTAPLNALSELNFVGDDLAKFATATAIWILVPGVLGWIRQVRAEVS